MQVTYEASVTAVIEASPRDEALRVLRVGMLGVGRVGRAVVEQIRKQEFLFQRHGVKLRVVSALVRDASRGGRGLPPDSVLTDDAQRFLAGRYDVAIEVLGGVEPANTLVSCLLARGVAVVTANKSLLAAHGPCLRALARANRTTLRREASVMAGVPLLGTLERRPLASCVRTVTGILNGTSNYVLSAMQQRGITLESALDAAQQRGYAEPDPTSDLCGIDAAEKLVVLLQELGVAGVGVDEIETVGIERLRPDDLEHARALGGLIKPVAHAAIEHGRVEAFVGPAFVCEPHPLSEIAWQNNGIRLRNGSGCDLFHSGPGAGPEVTAATILDDVFEIAAGQLPLSHPPRETRAVCRSPLTRWFLRLDSRDVERRFGTIGAMLDAVGVVPTRRVSCGDTGGRSWYVLTEMCARDRVLRARARLKTSFACDCEAWRVLEA